MTTFDERIEEARKGLKRRNSDPEVDNEEALADAVENLIAAVEELRRQPPVVDALQTLKLEPGDILIAKLGSRELGWIPGPEHEKTTLDLMNTMLEERGLTGKVTALVYHYGVEFEKLSADSKRQLIKDGHLDTPIHEQDGKWYFWNETWSDKCGPFDDREACAAGLRKYAAEL